MDILLVSVTERTREVGLRMTVGARPWMCLKQFLTESVLMSIAGGIAGSALGLGVSWGIGLLRRASSPSPPRSRDARDGVQSRGRRGLRGVPARGGPPRSIRSWRSGGSAGPRGYSNRPRGRVTGGLVPSWFTLRQRRNPSAGRDGFRVAALLGFVVYPYTLSASRLVPLAPRPGAAHAAYWNSLWIQDALTSQASDRPSSPAARLWAAIWPCAASSVPPRCPGAA